MGELPTAEEALRWAAEAKAAGDAAAAEAWCHVAILVEKAGDVCAALAARGHPGAPRGRPGKPPFLIVSTATH